MEKQFKKNKNGKEMPQGAITYEGIGKLLDQKIDEKLEKQEARLIFSLDQKLDRTKEELVLIMGKGFNDVHERIDGLEIRFDDLESNMESKFLEVNSRLDQIVDTKASYEYVDKIGKRVTVLEGKVLDSK